MNPSPHGHTGPACNGWVTETCPSFPFGRSTEYWEYLNCQEGRGYTQALYEFVRDHLGREPTEEEMDVLPLKEPISSIAWADYDKFFLFPQGPLCTVGHGFIEEDGRCHRFQAPQQHAGPGGQPGG